MNMNYLISRIEEANSIKGNVNLFNMWSSNPRANTSIPGKPSKSGSIGVWHEDNLYQGTSTIRNKKPHPTNIDSWTRSIRMASRRHLFFDKSFFSSLESHWCEPRDHVVTQPTIKIEIWSRKAEIGLIGVWHNGNLPQGTNTIGLSRMTPRSQLIFDKLDSVRSRTEECKNHSHTLKLKNSEVIIIKAAEILAYMSLNSSWKINPKP